MLSLWYTLSFTDIVHTKGSSDKGDTHVFKSFPTSQIDDSDEDASGDKDEVRLWLYFSKMYIK